MRFGAWCISFVTLVPTVPLLCLWTAQTSVKILQLQWFVNTYAVPRCVKAIYLRTYILSACLHANWPWWPTQLRESVTLLAKPNLQGPGIQGCGIHGPGAPSSRICAHSWFQNSCTCMYLHDALYAKLFTSPRRTRYWTPHKIALELNSLDTVFNHGFYFQHSGHWANIAHVSLLSSCVLLCSLTKLLNPNEEWKGRMLRTEQPWSLSWAAMWQHEIPVGNHGAPAMCDHHALVIQRILPLAILPGAFVDGWACHAWKT